MVANNSINNTVGASNTGTNTLTVQNTSNTASSRANVNIIVGDSTTGMSSGNAWTQYTVGGPSYAVGVANQPYTINPISPGYTLPARSLVINTSNAASVTPNSGQTTWSMGIGTNGLPCINLPTQPAFYYYYSVPTPNSVTGNGVQPGSNFVLGTPGFGTFARLYDQGIDNTGALASNVLNGVFTAPIAGIYFLSTGCVINNANSSHNLAQLEITNGSGNQLTIQVLNLNNSSFTPAYTYLTGGGRAALKCSCYVKASQGDTFKAQILVGTSTQTVGVFGSSTQFFSFFAGHLVA